MTVDTDNQAFCNTLERNYQWLLQVLLSKCHQCIRRLRKMVDHCYAYAREGEMFDLAARKIHIQYLRWLKVDFPYAELEVRCSKGTYIRSLVSDIGDMLGCGAHLTALRRTKIAHLSIDEAQTEEEIKTLPNFMAVDALVTHLPSIILNRELALRFKLGQRVAMKDVEESMILPPQDSLLEVSNIFKIYFLSCNSEMFLGLVEQKNAVLHPKRLMATDRLEFLLGFGLKEQDSNLIATDKPI
jgi:tRNA pseudouridine55 synthase